VRESSLLAEVALHLARSPEDVATEGLAYVLNHSPAAVAALTGLAGEWAPLGERHIASVRSQASEDDGSRPDLELSDGSGVPVILMENKFWAGLTEAQPNTYLERLRDAGGVLWFVAPAERLPLLWPTLLARAASAGRCPEGFLDSAEVKAARLGEKVSLAVSSWGYLLGQIERALEGEGDLNLLADVRQIEGLCARMETAGFLPLTQSDLTGPTGRLVVQYCATIDGASGLLRPKPGVDMSGLNMSHGAGWYGQYLRLHGHPCCLAFDARMWARKGRGPLWLRVFGTDFKSKDSERVERAIVTCLGRERCVTVRDKGELMGLWLPIDVPLGQERDDVVASVASQVMEVAGALEGLVADEPAAAAPPDDLPEEKDSELVEAPAPDGT